MTNASVKLRNIFNNLINALSEQGYRVEGNSRNKPYNVFYGRTPVMGMSCDDFDIKLNINATHDVKVLNDEEITFVEVKNLQELITKALDMAKSARL